MAHAQAQAHEHGMAAAVPHAEKGQQHPLGIYFKIWGLLFVLSAASYAVDYFHVQGYLRWFLIIVFMLLKAGLIVAEGDVENPVQAVFDRPVSADRLGCAHSGELGGRDVVAGLEPAAVAEFGA